MLTSGKANKIFKSRNLFVSILLIQIVIAGIVAGIFNKYLQISYQREGEIQFERALTLLNAKVDSYVSGLHGIGGIYITRNFQPSNQEAKEYAGFSEFYVNFPGVLGFGFIRYVNAKDRLSYENRIRKQSGLQNFTVKRLSHDVHDDLMVIESIEPFDFNQQAMGLDVGSEQKRREAAIHSMYTGKLEMTEHVRLVQSNVKEVGFLLFLPLYEKGITPATVNERKDKLKGWAYAPITTSAIKDYLIQNLDSALKFEIYEKLSSGISFKIADNGFLNSRMFEKIFNIGEQKWILKASYEREGFAFYIILLSGACFLVLSFLFLGISFSVRNLILSNDKTEKRAQIAEDWFSTIINSSNFCILSTDKFGVISTLNKAAVSLLGYAEHEVVRKLSPSFFLGNFKKSSARTNQGSENLNNVGLLLQKAKINGIEALEVEAFKRNGTKFPARLIVTPVVGGDSELEGFLFVLEDLTEVIRMRKEINLKQQQIVAASRLSSLGEMAAGLAHEINNPLAIISSKVDVMLDRHKKSKLDNLTLEESLQKINSMVQRIAKLVKGLKVLSRDATEDPLVPVSLIDIINDSVGLCGKRISTQLVSLSIQCPADVTVIGRAPQLTQVLVNLLTNALDAIEEIPEKWIRISVETSDLFISLKVVDSGFGIDSDFADKILDPFFTTKEIGRGTGLGLSISKSIIDEHKGKLYFDVAARNTTFVIELPVKQEKVFYSVDQN